MSHILCPPERRWCALAGSTAPAEQQWPTLGRCS